MSRTNEIVTENLKRWMDASENLKTQAALMRKPRRSIEDLLAGLAKTVPEFVAQVRAHGT